uniref:Uncharacterized protein n=1 Tax=Anguilla anguilla TaxID=7936 RepID=A0A0E9QAZ2_ANGAN
MLERGGWNSFRNNCGVDSLDGRWTWSREMYIFRFFRFGAVTNNTDYPGRMNSNVLNC